ncbi:MAG: tetratricopeptide repeat protein, partial [Polyangiaceae bacterium]
MQVLEDEPEDAETLAALDVLYGRLGRWEPYADVLRRRIELDLSEKDLLDLKFRLGGVLEKHIHDAAAALDNYREILFVEPGHEGARAALEAMLEGDRRIEAASILESIYEERGDWHNLIHALEILSTGESDVERRVSLKRKAARISADRVNDPVRAFAALASALRDEPLLAETRDEIEGIAAGSGALPSLVALYSELAEGAEDAGVARGYWMKIAGISEQLADVDRAAQAFTRVLALDAGDGPALAGLEELFSRTERWSELIGVVERRIERAVEAQDREALYSRIAQIYDERLGLPEEAVAAYQKVLEIDPGGDAALRALDALFTRQKEWGKLAEILESQLALVTTDDAQVTLMLRLSALREREMGLVDIAIEGYREVLDRSPSNAEALAALERLGLDEKYELTIADLLEPLYRQAGDWQKLIDVHEAQVRRIEDPARQVELLHRIAQLYEDAAGQLEPAFSTLARALAIDPANEATRQQLDRLARATGRFADLARVFEELAGRTDDPTLASALAMMSANVHE